MEGSGNSEKDFSLSRRALIKGAAGLAGSALVGGVGLKTLETIQQPLSEEEIEKKYNIRLVGTKEARRIVHTERFDAIPGDAEWDQEQLSMIDKCLSVLPNEFIEPMNDNPIHISLIGNKREANELVFNEMGGTVDTFTVPMVALNQNNFTKYANRDPLEVLTHEFIHLKNTGKDWQEIPAINEIFGGDFKDKKDEIKAMFIEASGFESREGESSYDRDMRYDLTRSFVQSAFQSDFANEFIAYLGQFYIHGKEHFLPTFTRILGDERTQALYEYAKNNLFYGKEYATYPVDAYGIRTVSNANGSKKWIEKEKLSKDRYSY